MFFLQVLKGFRFLRLGNSFLCPYLMFPLCSRNQKVPRKIILFLCCGVFFGIFWVLLVICRTVYHLWLNIHFLPCQWSFHHSLLLQRVFCWHSNVIQRHTLTSYLLRVSWQWNGRLQFRDIKVCRI